VLKWEPLSFIFNLGKQKSRVGEGQVILFLVKKFPGEKESV
jgi:hypothetical protein